MIHDSQWWDLLHIIISCQHPRNGPWRCYSIRDRCQGMSRADHLMHMISLDLTQFNSPKYTQVTLQVTFSDLGLSVLKWELSSGSLCSAGEHPVLWASYFVKIPKSISKSTEWIDMDYISRHVFRCSSSTQFWIVLGHLALIIPNLHRVVKGCGIQALWLTHYACQTDSNPRISCGCHWDGLGHNN